MLQKKILTILKSLRFLKNNFHIPVLCWAPGLVIPATKEGFFRYSRKYNELGQILFAFIARDLLNITESPENAGRILYNQATSDSYQEENFLYLSNNIKGLGNQIESGITFGDIKHIYIKYKNALLYKIWRPNSKS